MSPSLNSVLAAVLTAAALGVVGTDGFGADAQETVVADAVIPCPTTSFVQIDPDPTNAAYADPFVQASCTTDELVIRSNGIPGYEFQQITPNDLAAQDWEWHLPRHPALAEETTEIPLLGEVAVAVNGIPIYGPNEGPFPDPFGDPVYNAIVDWCLGHTAQRGDYHYHALLVSCLSAGAVEGEPSPVIAYSLDGFPIYGPYGCLDGDCSQVAKYRSGWQQIGDPTTYAWEAHSYQASSNVRVLDRCNGHVGPEGDYHYHATDSFPYILGCYHGADVSGSVPPTRLRAQRRTNGRVRLRWQDNADDEDGYQVDVAPEDGAFGRVAETLANRLWFTVRGLEAGTRYSFRVRARSAAGVSNPTKMVSRVAK